jgi:hypothetical protein
MPKKGNRKRRESKPQLTAEQRNKAMQYLEGCIQEQSTFGVHAPDAGVREMAERILGLLRENVKRLELVLKGSWILFPLYHYLRVPDSLDCCFLNYLS